MDTLSVRLSAICALSSLLTVTSVSAGGRRPTPPEPIAPAPMTYTFSIVDIPVLSGNPGRFIRLLSIANDGTMAGTDNTLGGFSSRITPDGAATAITCPPEVFTRYPFASGAGPSAAAMNNALTVVGSDDGVNGLYGFAQTVEGTCTFFQVPGSVGTQLTGIADTGTSVGLSFADPNVRPGLTRFDGFVKDGDTITILAIPGLPPNSVFNPTARNAVGDTMITGWLDIQPDNSYTYQAGLLLATGEFRPLDGPNGEDIYCTSLSNAGQATCGGNGQAGPWIYDSVTDTFTVFPAPTTLTVNVQPVWVNDLGQVVGNYTEQNPSCPTAPFCPEIFHQFLAIPQDPPTSIARRIWAWWHKKRQHCPRLKDVRDAKEARAQRQSNQPRPQDMVFMPAIDEDGTVVLVRGDGTQVRGRRH
jgi:hypothetical protein